VVRRTNTMADIDWEAVDRRIRIDALSHSGTA
jgi:hypothetical protein